MPEPRALTPTSYAILGLLAVQPWTTYELAKQVDQTLSRFWPRTRSKLYEEPKKLAEAGLAVATASSTGRRRSTVYAITPPGRRALAGWLGQESAPPSFESEHLLKVFYADNGSTGDLRGTLAELRSWVQEQSAANVAVGSRYVAGAGAFPERLPTLVLTSRFLDDYLELLDRWAAWAEDTIADWPEDPAAAAPDLEALAGTVEQARARMERRQR
jgi:DNA-binding PadR family transcriptional regulator